MPANAPAGDDEREALIRDLAECFRLSGADPDGNEDWRLARGAVDAVRELRKDYDAACGFEAERDEARAELTDVRAVLGYERETLLAIRKLVEPFPDDGGGSLVSMVRALRAERDALASKLAEIRREWESATERERTSEWLRKEAVARAEAAEAKLATMTAKCERLCQQYGELLMRVDASDKRAAALAEALWSIAQWEDQDGNLTDDANELREIARAALAGNGTGEG
jgi:chromosome segregation ATPase